MPKPTPEQDELYRFEPVYDIKSWVSRNFLEGRESPEYYETGSTNIGLTAEIARFLNNGWAGVPEAQRGNIEGKFAEPVLAAILEYFAPELDSEEDRKIAGYGSFFARTTPVEVDNLRKVDIVMGRDPFLIEGGLIEHFPLLGIQLKKTTRGAQQKYDTVPYFDLDKEPEVKLTYFNDTRDDIRDYSVAREDRQVPDPIKPNEITEPTISPAHDNAQTYAAEQAKRFSAPIITLIISGESLGVPKLIDMVHREVQNGNPLYDLPLYINQLIETDLELEQAIHNLAEQLRSKITEVANLQNIHEDILPQTLSLLEKLADNMSKHKVAQLRRRKSE